MSTVVLDKPGDEDVVAASVPAAAPSAVVAHDDLLGKLHTSGLPVHENLCLLTYAPLDTTALVDAVAAPSCGAISVFIGTTRDVFEGKQVVRLEYEAYTPMAVKEMTALCVSARERFDVRRIGVFHRLGVVPVKDASVVIAVASPHRRAAMDACAWLIDTLKVRVPIWKKEVYASDAAAWKQNPEAGLGLFPDSDSK
jgi:molybdopterin synthase catalytic subunit